MDGKDKHSRSLVKAVTYRIVASLTTFILVWIFTRQVNLALGVGIFDVLLKIAFYYFHERAWNKLDWGKYK